MMGPLRLTGCHQLAARLDRLSRLLPPRYTWRRKREPLGFRLLALKLLAVLAAAPLGPQRLTMRDRLPVLALRLQEVPVAP